MNYHYKEGNKKENILQELQHLDQGLMKDKKQLEKLKLEAQFYEDKTKPISIEKQVLADEIMNELISDPSKPKYNFSRPQVIPPPQQQYSSPPKEYLVKQAYVAPPQYQRQNNLVNQRELQKMKLQNQKHEGLFRNSNDHNPVRSLGKNVAQVLPEKDKGVNNYPEPVPVSPKKAKSPQFQRKYDPGYNPFVKDDAIQKQKKQQKHRQYLKALEQQRLQQQKQKKARLKQQKQMKSQKYDIGKPAEKFEPVQKPFAMKKSDPNSQPPKINISVGNYSQFDKNLIKSKVIQLRSKYKKGKIIYQEFEREFNNLRKQYPGDIDELEEEEYNARKQYEPPRQVISQPYKPQEEDLKFQSKEKVQEPKNEPVSFPIRNQSINYSQFMPSMVQQQSYVPIPGYTQNSVAPPMMPAMYGMMPPPSYFQGAPPAQYIELLKKMFDLCFKEVKDVRTEQSVQNQVLQQTLNKFLLMNTQQNLLTQQIPPIANQAQRQFYSDAKQHRQYFDKESNIKKKVMPSNQSLAHIPFGESDNSQYYDKSLSGIASKIPLNQVSQKMIPRDDEKLKLSALDQFYAKKYKVKPFKKFNIVVTPGQSQQEIPSTSSYFRAKNAKEELKNRFEQDLTQLKKMQKDKSIKKFEGKVISNSQYSSDKRILKELPSKLVGSQPFTQQISPISKQKDPTINNPYLKRHIQTEENMLTFHNKELKISSPTGFTPIGKKQILEQDEYLTQPKIKQQINGAASLINEYEEHLAQPVKALNFIKMNNQILSKYDKSQLSKRQYISIKDSGIKEISSRDYFVNNQISPVKAPDQYQQSLQTIRSDFQSVKQSIKQKVNTGKFQSEPQRRPEEVQLDSQQIIQTVESVQESSSRFRKPPIAKKRSVGKKKESSISRSKNPFQSNLSFSGSQQVDQSLGPSPKFDSNVYESNYEQSVDIVRPSRPRTEMVMPWRKQQSKQSYIQLNPPTIKTPKSISPAKQTELLPDQSKIPNSKLVAPQAKWKSLEEARKLAKEVRNKGEQSKDYRTVEQKFSQLESFMTKKGDQSQQVSRLSFEMAQQDQRGKGRSNKSKSKEKQKQVKKQGKKRNIMKLLQQLQDDKQQSYKQEFQSYREQSEQYQ